MAEDTKKTENTPESVSVEALQAENSKLQAENSELASKIEQQEKLFNESFSKLSEENETLKAKIAEFSEVKTDSKSNRTEKKGEVKIKILVSPAGKFLLPYNVDQVVWHPANQADEMVEARYAEYVK